MADGISQACLRLSSGNGIPRRAHSWRSHASRSGSTAGVSPADRRDRLAGQVVGRRSEAAGRDDQVGALESRRAKASVTVVEVVGQGRQPDDPRRPAGQRAGQLAGVGVARVADGQLGADAQHLGRQQSSGLGGDHPPQRSACRADSGRTGRSRSAGIIGERPPRPQPDPEQPPWTIRPAPPPPPPPPPGRPARRRGAARAASRRGCATRLASTRDAAMRALVMAHVDLAKAEAGAIAGRGRPTCRARRAGPRPRHLRGLPARHRRFAVRSGSGCSGRWAGASSTASCCSCRSRWPPVLLGVGVSGRRIGRVLVIAIVVGIVTSVVLGLGLLNQLYAAIGDAARPRSIRRIRPLVVGVAPRRRSLGLLVGIITAVRMSASGGGAVRRLGRPDRVRRGARRVHRDHLLAPGRGRASASPSATWPGSALMALDICRTGIDMRGPQGPVHADPDHRDQQGDARVATETDAARDRVLAARAPLGDELETPRGLGRGRRSTSPPRSGAARPRPRRVAGGTAFLVLGGPRRVFGRGRRGRLRGAAAAAQVDAARRDREDAASTSATMATRSAARSSAISRPTRSRRNATGSRTRTLLLLTVARPLLGAAAKAAGGWLFDTDDRGLPGPAGADPGEDAAPARRRRRPVARLPRYRAWTRRARPGSERGRGPSAERRRGHALDFAAGEWRNGRRAGLRSRCRESGVEVRSLSRLPMFGRACRAIRPCPAFERAAGRDRASSAPPVEPARRARAFERGAHQPPAYASHSYLPGIEGRNRPKTTPRARIHEGPTLGRPAPRSIWAAMTAGQDWGAYRPAYGPLRGLRGRRLATAAATPGRSRRPPPGLPLYCSGDADHLHPRPRIHRPARGRASPGAAQPRHRRRGPPPVAQHARPGLPSRQGAATGPGAAPRSRRRPRRGRRAPRQRRLPRGDDRAGPPAR